MRKNGEKRENINMKIESKISEYKNENQVKFWVFMVKKWGNIKIFQVKIF